MIDRSPPSAAAVLAASAIAAGGMLAHNVLELGPAFLVDPQTLIPLAIFAILAILAARETAGRGTWLALLAWGALNLVAGGILSVLPIGLFPFQPDQTMEHYGVHAVYALTAVPLVVVAWSGLQASRTRSTGSGRPRPGQRQVRRSVYDLLYRVERSVGRAAANRARPAGRGRRLDPGQLPPRSRALDLGCGTGANLRYLASHGFEVTGVDFSTVALRVAHQRAAEDDRETSIRLVDGLVRGPGASTVPSPWPPQPR